MSAKPRPYSTLRDGKIVWVMPGETASSRKVRSRLETDEEVRKRLYAVSEYRTLINGSVGKELDSLLNAYGLESRKWIDETC